MPGVGESEARDQEYTDLYHSMLPELDLVLWVIKADDRALSIDERFYHQIVLPYLKKHNVPLIIVVSQSDKIEPCREWDAAAQRPSQLQQQNLQSKRAQLSCLFDLPLSRICAVSGEYGYGLMALVEKIVMTLPAEKKWSIAREANPDYVSATSRGLSESGIWETIKRIVIDTAADAWEVISERLSGLGAWHCWVVLGSNCFPWLLCQQVIDYINRICRTMAMRPAPGHHGMQALPHSTGRFRDGQPNGAQYFRHVTRC